ncbi:hypothetical protein M9458_053431, partial [Cirrhinus mrigala]
SACKPKNPVQTSLTVSFANAIPYDKKSRRWLDLTRAITTHICKDMAPIHTVEKEGFKALVKTLDARYVMPSCKYFRQVELPSLYMSCRSEVENELRDVAHFATTTDLWTSRSTQLYMSLTIHFIIRNWTLCSRCLQTL